MCSQTNCSQSLMARHSHGATKRTGGQLNVAKGGSAGRSRTLLVIVAADAVITTAAQTNVSHTQQLTAAVATDVVVSLFIVQVQFMTTGVSLAISEIVFQRAGCSFGDSSTGNLFVLGCVWALISRAQEVGSTGSVAQMSAAIQVYKRFMRTTPSLKK